MFKSALHVPSGRFAGNGTQYLLTAKKVNCSEYVFQLSYKIKLCVVILRGAIETDVTFHDNARKSFYRYKVVFSRRSKREMAKNAFAREQYKTTI